MVKTLLAVRDIRIMADVLLEDGHDNLTSAQVTGLEKMAEGNVGQEVMQKFAGIYVEGGEKWQVIRAVAEEVGR